MGILLSVLDVAPVEQGASAADALRTTTALARHAEDLGCERFWVAEHHGHHNVASSSPAVVLATLAERTSRIRLGAGGVLLLNHSPLAVAEQFGTLNALHPDRFDLGIGRAVGGNTQAAGMLRRLPDSRFAGELDSLMRLLAGGFSDVSAVPPCSGPVWLLGSSPSSARHAAELGLPYAFAHHVKPEHTSESVALYRREFVPGFLAEPYAMVCVLVVCAADDSQARMLADPGYLSYLRAPQAPYPRPGQALSAEERDWVDRRQAYQAIGGPSTVLARLETLLGSVAPDELMVTSMVTDQDAKLESLSRVRDLLCAWPSAPSASAPQGLGSPG
jgi:luciferase family oxidoreductase group 1